MNAKNLPLKLGLLVLVVVICLLSLHYRGCQQGIDLRGGHSLIFDIRTGESERAEVSDRLETLRRQLDQAEDPQRVEQLTQDIVDAEQTLARLEQAGARRDLAEQIVPILKKRVDPEGLLNIEIRPLGSDRIEIRMPAGRPESRQARQEYLDAVEALEAGNVQRSEVRRLVSLTGEQRAQRLAELAGDNAELAESLRALAEAHDRMTRARAEGDDRARLNALSDYEQAYQEVLDSNVAVVELQSILDNYIPPREAGELGKSETDKRMGEYRARLEEFRARYPHRTGQIDRVVELYETWSDQRQYLDDPQDLIRLVAKAGVLEFRIAPRNPDVADSTLSADEADRYITQLQKQGPEFGWQRNDRFLWFPVASERESFSGLVTADYQGTTHVLLYNQPGYMMLSDGPGGWELVSTRPTTDQMNQPAVEFTFNEIGASRFSALTGAHQGEALAVLLDDEVYSAPNIQSTIGSRGIITGRFTPREVQELVSTLQAGSLPAQVDTDDVLINSFGPSIGQVNREQGIRAAYVGIIAVAVFMLIYYVVAGAIADVALVLNIILVLGAMSLLNAVFTLPGIAGIILTIGIAVDANVLIFERLREEQAKGQSVRMALKNAYERAFSAIFDANITTLITCLILGWVGTEEVRGFAITLGLGVMFSMFTALVLGRWLFQVLLDWKVITKPLFMLRILGTPKVNWMSHRHLFWGVSAALIVAGAVALWAQRGDIWGIEFSAGTQVVVELEHDALLEGELPDDQRVREVVAAQAAAMGPEYAKFRATARVETRLNPDAMENFLKAHDTAPDGGDGRITLAEWEGQDLDVAAFRKMDADGDGALTRQELEDTLPSFAYQISTTETQAELIRNVVRESLGEAQRIEPRSEFELAINEPIEPLGITTAPDGLTRIDAELIERAAAPYRPPLTDFEGGVLMVAENVDPSMSAADLTGRIRDMRYQPDFADQRGSRSTVIGLTPAEEEGEFTSFAVLIAPSNAQSVASPDAWGRFAAGEMELVTSAFNRETSMMQTNFDPAIAGETAQLAIVAVVLSWAAIIAYLWLRFGNWRWGLAAVVCLIHDTIIVVGLVAASKWMQGFLGIQSFKIDLAMVAAILTVIGYSVNDTIVVFDRIRENRGKLRTVSPLVINTSINQTLSRTLLTSGTTLIVLVIMYVWGGPGIHGFSYALLVGVLFGTYSSIAVASPLLMGFRRALVAKTAGAVAEE